MRDLRNDPARGRRARARAGFAAGVVLLIVSSSALADARAGAALARQGTPQVPACAACHGANGEGQRAAGFPRLAGEDRAYLVKQMQDYAQGRRHNAQMEPIARALSEKQIGDVADYYASLPAWQPPELPREGAAPPVPPPPVPLGEQLATRGNWDKAIPACFACHGPNGAGVPPHFPALAGQPRAYLRAQLRAFRTGARSNDPQGLMKSVAARMNDAEIDAVSLYLQNPSSSGRRE